MTTPLVKSRFTRLVEKLFPNLLMMKRTEPIPVKIHWRRIYILPTKPGLFYAVICLLMLIASLNFNNNLGLMMTFLLVGMAQVALHRVFFNLRNLVIKDVTSAPVFVDEKAAFHINLKSEGEKYDIKVVQETSVDLLLTLKPHKVASLKIEKYADQRGWLDLGRFKVSTSYPFGLFVAWVWTNLQGQKCLVYPKPEPNPPKFPQQMTQGDQAHQKIDGEEFHGLKPYQTGESKRLIAWKRTAQIDELVSRELETLSGNQIVFDYSQLNQLDNEFRISRLTAWVIEADRKKIEYKLILPSFESDFDNSNKHLAKCLTALALI